MELQTWPNERASQTMSRCENERWRNRSKQPPKTMLAIMGLHTLARERPKSEDNYDLKTIGGAPKTKRNQMQRREHNIAHVAPWAAQRENLTL